MDEQVKILNEKIDKLQDTVDQLAALLQHVYNPDRPRRYKYEGQPDSYVPPEGIIGGPITFPDNFKS